MIKSFAIFDEIPLLLIFSRHRNRRECLLVHTKGKVYAFRNIGNTTRYSGAIFNNAPRFFSTTKPSKILSCTEIYVLNLRLKISEINIFSLIFNNLQKAANRYLIFLISRWLNINYKDDTSTYHGDQKWNLNRPWVHPFQEAYRA